MPVEMSRIFFLSQLIDWKSGTWGKLHKLTFLKMTNQDKSAGNIVVLSHLIQNVVLYTHYKNRY